MLLNPFQNNLSVESESTIKTLEIVNTLGMTVYKNVVDDKQAVFSGSELPAGIYFIKIETEKGTATKRIVKQ